MKGARCAVIAIALAAACSDGALAQDPGTLAASAPADAIALGAGPTEITLIAPGGNSVAAQLRGAAGRQIYLTFMRAQALTAPATTYNVYLGLPGGVAPEGTSDPRYVGTLNFFNAASGRPSDISLNITPHAVRLSAETGDTIRVTIVPAGAAPEADAPKIGGVRITAR